MKSIKLMKLSKLYKDIIIFILINVIYYYH